MALQGYPSFPRSGVSVYSPVFLKEPEKGDTGETSGNATVCKFK